MRKFRFFLTTFAAWLVFLMIDFLAHASVLKPFWDKGYSALKSLDQLFVLIPFGYLSFLFLTLLVGWVYVRIYGVSGNSKKKILAGDGDCLFWIGDICSASEYTLTTLGSLE